MLLFTDVLADNIQVKYNNRQLILASAPVNWGGHIMVPMRSFFESLGFVVGWDEATQSVTASGRDSKKVSLQIGSTKIYVNNAVKTLEVAPTLISESTYVPVTVISATLACEVKWNEEAQLVEITDTAVSKGYSKYPGTQIINFGERFSDVTLYSKGLDNGSYYYMYNATAERYAEYVQMMKDEGWSLSEAHGIENFKTEIYEKTYNGKKLKVYITAGLSTFNSSFVYTVRISYVSGNA